MTDEILNDAQTETFGETAGAENVPDGETGAVIRASAAEETESGGEETEAENTAGERAENSPAEGEASGKSAEKAAKSLKNDFLELTAEYPDLRPEDIPDSVWEAFSKGGGGICELYRRYDSGRLRAENAALKRRIDELTLEKENAARSTGSKKSSSGSGASLIDLVWND